MSIRLSMMAKFTYIKALLIRDMNYLTYIKTKFFFIKHLQFIAHQSDKSSNNILHGLCR